MHEVPVARKESGARECRNLIPYRGQQALLRCDKQSRIEMHTCKICPDLKVQRDSQNAATLMNHLRNVSGPRHQGLANSQYRASSSRVVSAVMQKSAKICMGVRKKSQVCIRSSGLLQCYDRVLVEKGLQISPLSRLARPYAAKRAQKRCRIPSPKGETINSEKGGKQGKAAEFSKNLGGRSLRFHRIPGGG